MPAAREVETVAASRAGRLPILFALGWRQGRTNITRTTGSSVAANAGTYWVGAAMPSVGYKEHDTSPEGTRVGGQAVAANSAHLARLLRVYPYPSF